MNEAEAYGDEDGDIEEFEDEEENGEEEEEEKKKGADMKDTKDR
jgi:hypothetical protein